MNYVNCMQDNDIFSSFILHDFSESLNTVKPDNTEGPSAVKEFKPVLRRSQELIHTHLHTRARARERLFSTL